MKHISEQLFTQLKQLRKESLKKKKELNSGLNGIRTHDRCDAGELSSQLGAGNIACS